MSSPSGDVPGSDTTPSLPGWVYVTARPGYVFTSSQTPQVETVTVKAAWAGATKILTMTSSLQLTSEVVPTAQFITPIAAAAKSTNDDRILSPGAIAGLVIGSALGGVVVFCLAWRWFVCLTRRRRQRGHGEPGARHTFDPWLLLLRGSGKRPNEGPIFGEAKVHAGSVPQNPATDDKLVVAEGRTGEGGQRLSSMPRQGNVIPCCTPGRKSAVSIACEHCKLEEEKKKKRPLSFKAGKLVHILTESSG